MKHLMIRSKE